MLRSYGDRNWSSTGDKGRSQSHCAMLFVTFTILHCITKSQMEQDCVRGLQLTPQQYFPLTQLSNVTQPVISNICL